MKQARILTLVIFGALPLLSGCSILVATNADIDDGSVEKTANKDNDERLRRMRDSGALRPGEYDALRNRLGGDSSADSIPKPTTEELERRIEENRKATANDAR